MTPILPNDPKNDTNGTHHKNVTVPVDDRSNGLPIVANNVPPSSVTPILPNDPKNDTNGKNDTVQADDRSNDPEIVSNDVPPVSSILPMDQNNKREVVFNLDTYMSDYNMFAKMFFQLKTPTQQREIEAQVNAKKEEIEIGDRKQSKNIMNILNLLSMYHSILNMDITGRSELFHHNVDECIDNRRPLLTNILLSPWFDYEMMLSLELQTGEFDFWPAIVDGTIGNDHFTLFKRNDETYPLIFAWRPEPPGQLWFPEQPAPHKPDATWFTPFKWVTYWTTIQEIKYCVFDLLNHKDEVIPNRFGNVGSSFRISQDANKSTLKLENFAPQPQKSKIPGFAFFNVQGATNVAYITISDDLTNFTPDFR